MSAKITGETPVDVDELQAELAKLFPEGCQLQGVRCYRFADLVVNGACLVAEGRRGPNEVRDCLGQLAAEIGAFCKKGQTDNNSCFGGLECGYDDGSVIIN